MDLTDLIKKFFELDYVVESISGDELTVERRNQKTWTTINISNDDLIVSIWDKEIKKEVFSSHILLEELNFCILNDLNDLIYHYEGRNKQ